MKKVIRRDTEVKASEERKKLERTPESGHSYDEPIVFDNVDDMMKWWEDDKLYED